MDLFKVSLFKIYVLAVIVVFSVSLKMKSSAYDARLNEIIKSIYWIFVSFKLLGTPCEVVSVNILRHLTVIYDKMYRVIHTHVILLYESWIKRPVCITKVESLWYTMSILAHLLQYCNVYFEYKR